MSKKSTVKKQPKKQMSPEAKRTLGNVFKSLINNQAAIEGASEGPWWLAFLLLIISLLIPVLPITVSYSNAYGSSILANANYGADRGIANTFTQLKTDGYELKIEDGLLSFYKNGAQYTPTSTQSVADDINTAENMYNFRVYFTNSDDAALNDLINSLIADRYKVGTMNADDETLLEDVTYYVPSFLVLGKTKMHMHMFKNSTTDAASYTAGSFDWSHTPNGNLIDRVLTIPEDVDATNPIAKRNAIFENWKGVLNESYLAQRNYSTWSMSLIYLGIYTFMTFLMGLLVFLMTRGKTNPFRYLKFWVCQKIVWWAAPAPAILALIFGFLFSTSMIGQMLYVILLSFRIMWLSMRQLRPAA